MWCTCHYSILQIKSFQTKHRPKASGDLFIIILTFYYTDKISVVKCFQDKELGPLIPSNSKEKKLY